MATRYSLRQTPKKQEFFDGMVQTPARRRRSQFPLDASDLDGDSSSAAENSSSQQSQRARPTRRRARFVEHMDDTEDDTSLYVPPSEEALHGRKKAATNGHAQHANGNGHAKPTTTRAPGKVVDGWAPGMDHRIDYSGHFEFGGAPGVTAMMVGFPLLMWYMWIGATYYGGKIPTPAPGQSWADFANHLGHLVYTGAFPTPKAWAIYWTFLVFEAACYCLLPGVWAYGKPLHHLGDKQLRYYCSGQYSLYTTMAVAAALHFSGLFPLYTLIDEFGPLLSVAFASSFLVAVAAYASALRRGAQHRMTGSPLYDFWMGAELNPRLFGLLDFKMFFEVRLPWYVLLLLSCGAAARQYERYGFVSGEVAFLVMAHYLYANACSKGEELIVSTWDMYYEKWGFMLIFWNMAGVPLSYCHCTIYLANHAPDEYRWNRYALAGLYVAYLFVYWVWDSCNSQKNRFRALSKGKMIARNAFPQLPWQTLQNPQTIKTQTGDDILVDGWYGLARKVHYTCDLFFSTSWALICGFNSPFPWFYPVFFTCMVAHRCLRDIQRCRRKYGDAWTEYENRVPYLFIPYVI